MIVYKIKSLMDIKGGREGRKITLEVVAKETSISDSTLRSIAGRRGYNTTMKQVDMLCRYFECQPGELMAFVDESQRMAVDKRGRRRSIET